MFLSLILTRTMEGNKSFGEIFLNNESILEQNSTLFYQELYNDWRVTTCISLVWLLCETIGNLLLLSMISVKDSLSISNLHDSSVNFVFKTLLLHNIVVMNLNVAMAVFGHLNESLCTFSILVRVTTEFWLHLSFQQVCLTRCCYVVVKNIFAINEEFISHFLAIYNTCIAAWYEL